MEGIIIKNISNDYTVKAKKETYVCKPRGKFRQKKIIPLVGDRVVFDEKNNYIIEIKPRHSTLIRPSVANVDIAIVVTSVKKPNFDTKLLDKLLTIISYNNIEPIICFTKIDLLLPKEKTIINSYIKYYQKIGYKTITNEPQDQNKLEKIVKNKIVVLTGQSGSGKSSLLNKLNPNLKLKTNEISTALNRGIHTTRHTELYELLEGYIVDTPGFSQIDFHQMTKEDIRDNMKEMFNTLHYCKYRDCMHINEEGCMVKEKVAQKEILNTRYENYKQFISSQKNISNHHHNKKEVKK